MAKKRRLQVRVSESMEKNKNSNKKHTQSISHDTENKTQDQTRVVSKERIRNILNELEHTGVLEKLNGERNTLNVLSGASEQQNRIKELKSTAEFIKTIQQAVSSNRKEELTIDSIIQGMAKIKETIQHQATESFNPKSSREE
ncbi:hypothetical protein [Alkalihalobacillus sp. BA299]|uniref:hypothetical protein n=1 Tax=Alkalihalobacillus sp. BA299 TaxID=2815938 RepID=UPI001ADCE173|nr:hypothetical protein [Alkalihalobacillus sp. BA299]